MSIESYWSHVTNAASVAAFHRDETVSDTISAEALPENSSLIDFKSFAQEYPEKLFPLLQQLRPEFQEIFIEYWLLEKSQSFIAKVHGTQQSAEPYGIWQTLRVIEQALGGAIVLGANPDTATLQPIIEKAGLEVTPFGSLTTMIVVYAQTLSYAAVAKELGAPVPAIRKIFRPAVSALLASKDLKTVAVGSYLHNLTRQVSLTGSGPSESCIARLKRVKRLRFDAPTSDTEMFISFGDATTLQDTPWVMFEISSEHGLMASHGVTNSYHCEATIVASVFAGIRKHGKKLFGKKAAQIFAPTDTNGNLELGYILARSSSPALTRSFSHVRGISEMAGIYNEEGLLTEATLIPHTEVLKLIKSHSKVKPTRIQVNDFVEILTGKASRYCGTVKKITDGAIIVEVNFPTGRRFTVTADASGLKVLHVPVKKRAFWGEKLVFVPDAEGTHTENQHCV